MRVKAYDRTSHQPPRMIPDLKSKGSASWQALAVLAFWVVLYEIRDDH